MPSLLWTGSQKVCLDQTCFRLNVTWDFTSAVWDVDSACRAELLSLNIRCVLSPGFVPGLGFLPCRVQKQVGTEVCQTQSDRNWRKRWYTNAFVFMLYSWLTVTFCSRTRGAAVKTIHSTEFCCLHTCPISANCYDLKIQILHWED